MQHRIPNDMEWSHFPSATRSFKTGEGWLYGCFNGVPTASAVGWAPGALAIDTSSGVVYTNTGSKASATWTEISSTSSTGTTATSFTINSGSSSDAKIKIDTDSATGNFTLSIVADDLSGNVTLTLPTTTGILALTSETSLDLDLGSSGSAGSLDIFPATVSNGKLIFTASNMGGAWNMAVTNDTIAAGRAYKIPDAGGDGKFVMTTAANSLLVNANGSDRTMSLSGDVVLAGDLTTGANLTFSGAYAATIAIPEANTWTLPAGGGTLATATGAELGTTNASFTIDSDSGAAKVKIDTNGASGAYTQSWVPANLTSADATITFPDTAGNNVNLVYLERTQTFTGDKTFTGTVNLQGNVSASSGNPNLDFSASNGTFKTTTGVNTFYGNVIIDGSKTFTTGTGAIALNGAVTVASGIAITSIGGGGDLDWSSSSGEFKSGTGAVTLSGAVTLDASAPNLTTAAGKSSTGIIQINGMTSGALKLTAADSAGQIVTVSLGAQTGGAATITIPDQVGVSSDLPTTGLANTFIKVQTVAVDDQVDGVVDLLVLKHSSDNGQATVGDGAGVSFELENVTGTSLVEEWGSIDLLSTDITDGGEDGDFVFSQMLAGNVTESMRLDSSDQSLTIGRNANDAAGMQQLRIFPVTLDKGSLVIQAVANDGDTVTTIKNAPMGQTTTITIPDPNDSASEFVLLETSQVLINKSIDSDNNVLTNLAPVDNKEVTEGLTATPPVPANTFVVSIATANGAETVTYTVASGKSLRVLDVWGYKTTQNGGATAIVTVKNNGVAITDGMDINITDKVRFGATTIDDAQTIITSTNPLQVVTSGGTNHECVCNILCCWI